MPAMTHDEFLNQIITRGIAACERDYADRPAMREGSIAGFEACRGKTADQLRQLLQDAYRNTLQARHDRSPDYWRTRCFELEVEWVCNVVSAAAISSGGPFIVPPTARGVLMAAQILGVAPTPEQED